MTREIYPQSEFEHHQSHSKVYLVLRSENPNTDTNSEENYATTIAGQSGRTCYSANIQFPSDYRHKSDKYRQVTDGVVRSTREAGHLTTRQHVHYTFALEGVSRLAVNFFHSHPHYNSEEMSQRYVTIKNKELISPQTENPETAALLESARIGLISGYEEITASLTPLALSELQARFPGRKGERYQEFFEKEAQKKAQEVARYLLPLGTPTNLYHTISELTLVRLYHLSETLPNGTEAKAIVQAMVDTVAAIDPSIIDEIGKPYPKPYSHTLAQPLPKEAKTNFDLAMTDSFSLQDTHPNFISSLARSVQLTLGLDIPEEELIGLLLDPKQNSLISSVWGETVLDQLGLCLNQVHLTGLVSLSHTANYQLHRHRGFTHTEPLILDIPDLDDIVIPALIKTNSEIEKRYLEIHHQHLQTLHQLQEQGVSLQELQYLLPNSTRVRKQISGPLGSYLHFIKSRTCLNAQEEIYQIAVQLTQQLSILEPSLVPYLNQPAPCGLRNRASITPYCPEGSRFCGIKIWDLNISDYPQRTI